MERRHYPSDLTDVQWQVIEPLLPGPFNSFSTPRFRI